MDNEDVNTSYISGKKITHDGEDILTTQQVAEILELSVQSVYRYLKNGEIKPIYQDKWKQDKSHLFRLSDVEALKLKIQRPQGKGVAEAAAVLNASNSTVIKYIKSGELKATMHKYKGRNTYFIQDQDLADFKERKQGEGLSTLGKSRSFAKDKIHYLFQPFVNGVDVARVIAVSPPIELIWDNKTYTLDQIREMGFTPFYKINIKKTIINKQNKIVFEVPVNYENLNSIAFKSIDMLIQIFGVTNIKFEFDEKYIKVIVYETFIELDQGYISNNEELFSFLKKHISQGALILRHNGYIFDSELNSITFPISKELKESLKNRADKLGISLKQHVQNIVLASLDR